MSPLMWICTLVTAAVLLLVVRLAAQNHAALGAQVRASEAWQRTGRAQPGWAVPFAWAHDRWPVEDDPEDDRPVTVTAEVVQSEPARWWHQDTVRSEPARLAASPASVTAGEPAGSAGAPASVPQPGARATVDGVPGRVTGVERLPQATRLTVRRDDGVVGHVDIPDVDHAIPVQPTVTVQDSPGSGAARQAPPPVPPAWQGTDDPDIIDEAGQIETVVHPGSGHFGDPTTPDRAQAGDWVRWPDGTIGRYGLIEDTPGGPRGGQWAVLPDGRCGRITAVTDTGLRLDLGDGQYIDVPRSRQTPAVPAQTGQAQAHEGEHQPVTRAATPSHTALNTAPTTADVPAVTLGGFTVSLGARTAPSGLPQTDAERRTKQLRAGGYTGPIDPDGYPVGWPRATPIPAPDAKPSARAQTASRRSAPSQPPAVVTLGGFTISGCPQ
jgi:hypothetical protein